MEITLGHTYRWRATTENKIIEKKIVYSLNITERHHCLMEINIYFSDTQVPIIKFVVLIRSEKLKTSIGSCKLMKLAIFGEYICVDGYD